MSDWFWDRLDKAANQFADLPSWMKRRCETCDGDRYVDVVDDWGGVIGSAPCPNCSDADPLEAVARTEEQSS